jgi:hydrogenase/urease accessory protein HupE
MLPLLLVLIAFAAPPGLAAAEPVHELERTQVRVSFTAGGQFQIDVGNDPDWLLARVEPFSGLPLSRRLDPSARDRRLAELVPTFARWVWVYFDGERADVTVEYLPPPPSPREAARPPLASMRLTGEVPQGAKTFSWAYGLVVDPYPMVVTDAGGAPLTRWVDGDLESEQLDLAALTPVSRWRVSATYLGLGFTHILPKGLDHILFVLGIFLLSARWRPVVAQITTFTVAHTLTLALAIFGVLSLPSRVVEPLIALSIAYVAFENLVTSELKPWRIGLVFTFGLLHGMGFAGVLSDVGLPRPQLVPALLSFNLGVEGGQLTVIALAFVSVGWLRNESWYRRRAVWPLSLLIGGIGLYWTAQRILAG